MEDFMKEGTKKMVKSEEHHHKTNYHGKHHAKAPYSSSEMSHAMDCYQKQGNGLGGHHKAKMPEYEVYGQVVSVTHGHHDVGPKI